MKTRNSLVSNSSTSSFISIVPSELHNKILMLGAFQDPISTNPDDTWNVVLKKQVIQSNISYRDMNGSEYAIYQYKDVDNEVTIPSCARDDMSSEEYISLRNIYLEEICKLEKEKKAITISDYE